MKDLRPYICTFPKCSSDPGKLYSSRQAWFQHELVFHRRQWHCPFDRVVFSDFSEFDSHLKEMHPGRVDAVSFEVLSRGKEIPHTAEAKCPFCWMTLKSRRQIESHIGRHEERIALMALSSMRDYHDDSNEESREESVAAPNDKLHPQGADEPSFAKQHHTRSTTAALGQADKSTRTDDEPPLKIHNAPADVSQRSVPEIDPAPVPVTSDVGESPPSKYPADVPEVFQPPAVPLSSGLRGSSRLRAWILSRLRLSIFQNWGPSSWSDHPKSQTSSRVSTKRIFSAPPTA